MPPATDTFLQKCMNERVDCLFTEVPASATPLTFRLVEWSAIKCYKGGGGERDGDELTLLGRDYSSH